MSNGRRDQVPSVLDIDSGRGDSRGDDSLRIEQPKATQASCPLRFGLLNALLQLRIPRVECRPYA